ncbi:MAG: zinc-dependent metalloprotease [Saprospiraceae bacterium]|nr:zinc-dependent metalloprotease [Saprospiraceae bacterium]MBP7679555.1 zinc-dependent metalloprotease [Saprospiraceae bacterium]
MKQFAAMCILMVLVTHIGIAQQQDLQPCGTVSHRSPWLKRYQQMPHQFRNGADTVLQVPLQVHLLANDNATNANYFSMMRVLDALCRLNQDFSGANIQFYLKGEPNKISSTAWNNHATVVEGAYMMFANNVDSAVNCYIVADPAGNCGYNLPYAGVALARNCTGATDHTWAHELGHAFSLPHPFLGWEGGVSWDNSVSHNFNDPAPTRVTYNYTNFKDSLITDTLIIDTAWVELTDRSNCTFAADGFCDTWCDYLSYRWQCNAVDTSIQVQTDPDGVTFHSDGSLFMSYALDDCQDRFSGEQIAAMRANLYDEKPELLANQNVPPIVSVETPVLITPIDSTLVQYNNVVLQWEAVPNAVNYVVQVSRFSNFDLMDEYIVTTNEHTITNLLKDKYYYWRVRPFSSHSFCTTTSEKEKFKTAELTSTSIPYASLLFEVYPTVAVAEQALTITIAADNTENTTLQVLDVSGRILAEQKVVVANAEQSTRYAIPNLPKGIYFLRCQTAKGMGVAKFVVQ